MAIVILTATHQVGNFKESIFLEATLFVIEIVLHLMVLKRILEITSKMHGKVHKVRTRYALDSRCCTYLCNSKIHENAFVLENE